MSELNNYNGIWSTDKRICLIQQEAGLGDILFCQGIAEYFHNNGYKVIWPVVKELIDTVEYIKTNAEFFNRDEEYPMKKFFLEAYSSRQFLRTDNNDIFIPIGYSSYMIFPFFRKIMQSKFSICNLNFREWKKDFNFNRNVEKENKLYYDVLGLKDNEDFILLNQTYSTQPTTIKKDLTQYKNTFGEFKIVEMSILDEFTLFDWCKVFENMKSIITVDTSLMYIIEKLELKNKTDFLCITRSPTTEEDIKELFTYPWSYIHA